jgi:hypothetical protein
MGKEPLNTKYTRAMRENTNDRYWLILLKK